MKAIKVRLTIRHNERQFWGRFRFDNYGSEVPGDTLEQVINLAKKDLSQYCNLTSVTFELAYDITAVFKDIEILNVTAFARFIDINPGLMRQYASGSKHPSAKQMKKILEGFFSITRQMNRIALAYDGKPLYETDPV